MMKKLLLLVFLIAGYLTVSAQNLIVAPNTTEAGNDSSRYIWYKFQYGNRQPRYWADSVLEIPKDTLFSKSGLARKSGVLYVGDGTRWYQLTPGGGIGGDSPDGPDSVIIRNYNLCVWKDGASTCTDLSKFIANISPSYDYRKYILKNGNDDILDSVDNNYTVAEGGQGILLTKRGTPPHDTLNISATGGSSASGLLQPGYVTHDTLYTYDVTAAIFRVGSGLYSSASGSVTLNTADGTFDRIDVIALDTLGHIVAVTGTASANPQIPQVNPTTQIALTSILVKVGTTAPDNITREIVYDENVEYSHTATLTPNFNFTGNPVHLTKSIDIAAWTTSPTSAITFTSPVKLNISAFNVLKFFIDLKATLPSNAYIFVALLNGSTYVTPYTEITTAFGLNRASTDYQNISVPFSSLAITGTQFDKLQFYLYGPGPGMYLDYVQFQGGISNGNSPYLTDLFQKANTDSIFKVMNGVPSFAYRNGHLDTTYTTPDSSYQVYQYLNGHKDSVAYITNPAITSLIGDVTGSGTGAVTTTLATVNSNVGSWNHVTVNAKGLVTAGNNITYLVPADTVYIHAAILANTAAILLKLNISDTTAMLSPYKALYPRQAISLTTTGSSGAATYNSSTGVFNIPQYSGGGGGATGISRILAGYGETLINDSTTAVDSLVFLNRSRAVNEYLPIIGRTYTTTGGIGLNLTTSTLTSGNLVSFYSSGTAATGNNQTLVADSTYGANATSSQTTYGHRIYNVHSGTAATNVALLLSASGGTNNYALVVPNGNVGIGNSAPSSSFKLDVTGGIRAASGGGVSYAIDQGSAIRGDGSTTQWYLDGNGSLTGQISLRATTFVVSAAETATSLTSTSFVSASPSAGYNIGTIPLFNTKGDSTILRVNDNAITPGIGVRSTNIAFSDSAATSVINWQPWHDAAIVEIDNKTARGFLLPRLTSAQISTINLTGVGPGLMAGGTGYTTGVHGVKSLTGGTGSGATAKITVAGGVVTSFSMVSFGTGYTVGDVLGITGIGAGSGFSYTIYELSGPAGVEVYCKDCTAVDGSTGVTETWNGTVWKKNW